MLAGWEVVLVHGNGPQVGNLAIQQEEGSDVVPEQPLFSLGAMTEGQLGSVICLALGKMAGAGGSNWMRGAVAVVTHVSVSPDDAAFDDPTKPIGPFFSKEQADALGAERGWAIKPDAGRGYRRVVPSPLPVTILETPAIRALLEQNMVVVACGGGGVPVVRAQTGYQGVDAVIDKDYAASQLATALAAEALVLVTGVESVLLHYGTPEQVPIHEMSVVEAEQYLEKGEFPEGSMGPKIRAATGFLRRGGEIAVVTTPQLVYASLEGTVSRLEGESGTRIVRMRPLIAAG
jgi:carbamate kinase